MASQVSQIIPVVVLCEIRYEKAWDLNAIPVDRNLEGPKQVAK